MAERIALHENASPTEPVVRLFEAADWGKLVLTPYISRFYSPAIAGPLIQQGVPVQTLPPPDRESVEIGLRFCNNEICYPGIIYIGDMLKHLLSGRYDTSEIAVGSWQTGGQCRASCILVALKRAMAAAGFRDVPVVALTAGTTNHEQPGFSLSYRRYIPAALLAFAYGDGVAAMTRAAAARERVPGSAYALADAHMGALADGSLSLDRKGVAAALADAVADFNALDLCDDDMPAAGIVGEVFLKHSRLSNHAIVDWLIGQGVEPIVPPLVDMFLAALAAPGIQAHLNVRRPGVRWVVSEAILHYMQAALDELARVEAGFRYHRPHYHIREVASIADEVVSLAHQYGESWLVAGEIGGFARAGVKNVLCLQPFGCIANHVVAKGAERALRRRYEDLNLLFLDTDAGSSEVNFFNRMHFFVSHAKRFA